MRFKFATSLLSRAVSGNIAHLWHRAIGPAMMVVWIVIAGASVSNASCIRDGDEFWVINTRHISSNICNADLENPNLDVSRYQAGDGLTPDSLPGLLDSVAAEPDFMNLIYIHGNRFTRSDAIRRTLDIYKRVRKECKSPQRIRWILWSWPSDPIMGPITDARTKAPRADAQTLYLGWFMQQFPAVDRLQLIGYSFGARIATGALHTAAGGSMYDRVLPGAPIRGARISVNLIAPAMDRHWLGSGSVHGMASENIGTLNLFYNNRDRVLMLFSFVSKYYNPVALGFKGLSCLAERSDGTPLYVYQKNCSKAVGLLHDELKYYQPCCSVARRIGQTLDEACGVPTCLRQKRAQ